MKNPKRISTHSNTALGAQRRLASERRPEFPAKVEPAVYPVYFLTLRETAKILGVCVRTVQNYISSGILKSVTIGRRTKRVRNIDLDDFGQSLEPRIPAADPEPAGQMTMDILA